MILTRRSSWDGRRVTVVELRTSRERMATTLTVLRAIGRNEPIVSGETITLPVDNGRASLVEAIHRLDAAGLAVEEIALRRPTLDEVFLKLTGQDADIVQAAQEVA